MKTLINTTETTKINLFIIFKFGDSYHIIPGTNNKLLFHFSLTLCFFVFFLKQNKPHIFKIV